MAEVTIPTRRIMRDTTISVRLTGRRAFAIRSWVAVRLLKLAALVFGCQIDVDFETP